MGFFGSLRSSTSRSRPSTVPLSSVSTSVPYSPSTAIRPWASSCRTTPRHSASASSSPMPNTESWSWSNWMTFAVLRPSRMSMIWPAPNFCPRSRFSRTTVDSSFWETTVPSQVSGGVRQVSQLPQEAVAGSWPKYFSSWARRHCTVSHSASIESRCEAARRRNASSPSPPWMSLRCWTTSWSPYAIQAVDGAPSRPARPVSW